MTATAVSSSQQSFEDEDLFLKLAFHADWKVFKLITFSFALFLHKSLLNLAFLFFADFDHDLFDTNVHLLAKIILIDSFSIDPGMFHDHVQTEALFGVRI